MLPLQLAEFEHRQHPSETTGCPPRTLEPPGIRQRRPGGEETEESDLDLLVDVTPGVGLIGLARAQHELEELLGARVDLVPASDLKPGVAASVLPAAMLL